MEPKKRGKNYLNRDDIFYIRNHLSKGIKKEVIAAAVYCDLEDVEGVERRYPNAHIQNVS